MSDDLEARVSELETTVAGLSADHRGHEKLCTERWTEFRNLMREFMSTSKENHTSNIARFSALEHLVSKVKGGWIGISILAVIVSGLVSTGVALLAATVRFTR